jgi:hypothetical protein
MTPPPVDPTRIVDPTPPGDGGRIGGVELLAFAALVSILLLRLSEFNFPDPDMYHEMALIREAVNLGQLQTSDSFAYTPTVDPVVHHEWGTGAILYFVVTRFDATGLMILKFSLIALIAIFSLLTARRRGARLKLLLWLISIAIILASVGFATIRAQLFTLTLLSILVYLLERDRAGDRTWPVIWLPLHMLWVNLHAGFVVGIAFLTLHCIERVVDRKPAKMALLTLVAAILTVAINPYGPRYFAYLAHALTLERPLIGEWKSLWSFGHAPTLYFFALSLILVAYAVIRRRPGSIVGLPLVLVAAVAACRHTRHLSIYAVTWLAIVPGMIQHTDLGQLLGDVWTRHRKICAIFCLSVATVSLAKAIPAQPWRLEMPVTAADRERGRPVYPVGAVGYLKGIGFQGRLMTPFVQGAYVSWHMYPDVKVSLDGRYEVAYQPGVLEKIVAFYNREGDWHACLREYGADAILVPTDAGVRDALGGIGWRPFYRDAVFEVYFPSDSEAPTVDARGTPIRASFP